MKRDTLLVVDLILLSALLLPARFLLGVEIAPASARDILNALGPDASGLHISQEALPDLFTLTASRIEENPAQFTVEEPYVSGRWKGGKAVIEYARDLSYTIVNIYDRNGHRQRIYSVTTAFNDRGRHQEAPAAQATEEGWAQQAPPPSASEEEPARNPSQGAVAQTTPAASPAAASFEWDETKGVYVQARGSVPAQAAAEEATAQAPASRT